MEELLQEKQNHFWYEMEQQLQGLMQEFDENTTQIRENQSIIENTIQLTKEELNNLCSYTSKTIRDKKYEVDTFLNKVNKLKKDLIQIESSITPLLQEAKQNEIHQTIQPNDNSLILPPQQSAGPSTPTSYWNVEEYQSIVEVATKLQQNSEERLKEIMQILDELKQWRPQ